MRIISLVLTVVLLSAAGVAVADDGTWAVDADGNWSDFGNWVSGVIADGADYTAYFTHDISAVRNVDLTGNRTIGHLVFSDGGADTNRWTIDDLDTWTLTLSAPSGTPSITCTNRTWLWCALVGTQGFIYSGGENLDLGNADHTGLTGDIVVNGSRLDVGPGATFNPAANFVTNSTVAFNASTAIGSLSGTGSVLLYDQVQLTVGAGGQTTTFNGYIEGLAGGNPESLRKIGSGTLTLTSTSVVNDWRGGTTLENGVISVSDQENLGDGGGLAGALTFDGGTLQVTGTTFGEYTRGYNWAAGGGTFDIADGGHTFTVNDALTGSGGLTKIGPGTLALAGANTFEGGTIIEAGTLRVTGANERLFNNSDVQVDATGTFHVDGFTETIDTLTGTGTTQLDGELRIGNADSTFTYDGNFAGSGDLRKLGTGTWTLIWQR